AYETPSASPAPSRKPSTPSIRSSASSYSIASPPPTQPQAPPISKGFFSRFTSSSLSVPTQTNGNGSANGGVEGLQVDGPVDNLIIAGTAFGYGLFNLVFSLLPKKVQGVVGFLGFKHDRKLALRALAVSASKNDVHSVFSGLVLMTYYGVVLLLSGYQADETHIVRQYKAIVDRVESRFPEGALWILNRVRLLSSPSPHQIINESSF
ncbi:Mitochondrial outer membrane protein iml2, partial [Arthromyces matolae]